MILKLQVIEQDMKLFVRGEMSSLNGTVTVYVCAHPTMFSGCKFESCMLIWGPPATAQFEKKCDFQCCKC